MALFNLDDLNPGAWFDYEDGRVKVRVANPEILSEINKKHIKKRVEYKKIGRTNELQRFEVTDPDDDSAREAIWDYVIQDWEGFETLDGELECTTENKILLMNKSAKFYEFIDKCIQRLTLDVNKEVEASEKN